MPLGCEAALDGWLGELCALKVPGPAEIKLRGLWGGIEARDQRAKTASV